MKHQLRFSVRWLLSLLALGALVCSSGCATKKAIVKEEKIPQVDESELALKTFKEGAELLFIDNKAALAKFAAAGTLQPSMVEAHFNAGVASEALGQNAEAAKFYEQCLQHKKDMSACLSNLLLVRVKLGETSEANDTAQRYLSEFPEEPFALVAAAKLAFVQDNLTEAEKYAKAVIEREAENTEALEIMGRIFFAQKKYAAAKWVVKNALEYAPAHGGLHLLLGHIFMRLGLLHDALDSYENAVKFLPTEEALESYGLLLMKRGRVAESLPVLLRLVELRPLDYRNHLHLGNSYMASKKFEDAKAAYEKALALAPAQKDIYLNLGLLYYDLKPTGLSDLDRMKMASRYFQQFLEQPGVSKSRIDEVNGYLNKLKDKISYEEESAKESAAAQEEEAPSEIEAPKDEAAPEDEPLPPIVKPKDEAKDEEPFELRKEETLPESQKNDEPNKREELKGKKEENEDKDFFDEENEDF